ncbi:MAG TPA: hypothetical protein VMN36_10200 [Verrucomicrobiales bacterium]|nr:hypothetical protein [Verrucomicrobiales bacterium]
MINKLTVLLLLSAGWSAAPLLQAQEGSPLLDPDESSGSLLDLDDPTDPDAAVSLDPNRSAADPLGPGSRALPSTIGPEDAQPQETWVLPESIQNLTREQRNEIVDLLNKATSYIRGIRLQEGMDALNKIEAHTSEYYVTHNLRGAIYTKLRSFDKARTSFRRVLELRPGLMEARFNLAELDFVEKKFQIAFEQLEELKRDYPQMEASTAKMIDYKRFLCSLMQSNGPGDAMDKKARAILATFDFLDDEPAYYCAHAALSYKADDTPDAEMWLNSARDIYGMDALGVYVDSMIEMGWIDSMF